MNTVMLIGRAGKDPNMEYYDGGVVKTTITLAVDRRTSNEDKQPDWFDVRAWGKLAEIMGEYVKKGKQLCVVGRIEKDSWTDKNTDEKKTRYWITAEKIELLGGGGKDEGSRS